MSKILQASCDASGVVTADGATVAGAVVLSEGKQASTGLLFLEGDKATYIPSSALDLKTTLEKVVSALGDISDSLTQACTIFTEIGAGMLGPSTAPPPTLAVDVAQITAKVSTITATKTALDTLRGALK